MIFHKYIVFTAYLPLITLIIVQFNQHTCYNDISSNQMSKQKTKNKSYWI